MDEVTRRVAGLLDAIVSHLQLPKSYYEKAAARHRSLGEWLVSSGPKPWGGLG